MADDLVYATIAELNAKLKKREVSSVELTKTYLDRLESLGPQHNALALSFRKEALKKAKYVDADIKIERFRGPLQGIPFGAKDLLAMEGHPTTWGAKPYATQVFKETASVLKKTTKRVPFSLENWPWWNSPAVAVTAIRQPRSLVPA